MRRRKFSREFKVEAAVPGVIRQKHFDTSGKSAAQLRHRSLLYFNDDQVPLHNREPTLRAAAY